MAEDINEIVRIAGSDIKGEKSVLYSLSRVKGVGIMFSHALLHVAKIDPRKKAGLLSEDEINKLEEIVSDPQKYNIPVWMLNRRNDYTTGQDKHVTSNDLIMNLREDIMRLRKIRAYRGIRHERGLRCRGQRTKSTGRRGSIVGVQKQKKELWRPRTSV